ncbi:hypothetical protein MVEN_01075300 [Mycena venus]|uniref:F-box domain-containing protein n=1 Tax=Mycena venus TaxID=2733690 RepID=A0A8H6Y7K4_9AGAR|nr:hypothetical protein MVEN_01075300 [Mycena venus]
MASSPTSPPYKCPVSPPKITDAIIDELRGSLPALRVCSLVCSDWLPASRNILNRSISLRAEQIPAFMELLESPTNTYCGRVRDISLGSCLPGPIPSLGEIFLQFTDMQSIHIHSSHWHHDIPLLPGVVQLNLSGIKFPSFAAFFQLASRFPSLKSLSLGELKFVDQSYSGAVHFSPLPGLPFERLSLKISCENMTLLHWLASENGAPPLMPHLTLIVKFVKPVSPFPRNLRVQPSSNTFFLHARHNALLATSRYLDHLSVRLKYLVMPFIVGELTFVYMCE